MVFHEQDVYENGRPTWLLSINKQWIDIDLQQIKLQRPYFLFAFKEGENITEAVPVDLLEITDSTKTANFALSNGNYQIVAQNKATKALSFEMEVE